MTMRRREFLGALVGIAPIWSLAAHAQQAAMPLVVWAAIVEIEYRWAEGRNERLPDLAADLVRRGVVVIAAVGGNNSAGLVSYGNNGLTPTEFAARPKEGQNWNRLSL